MFEAIVEHIKYSFNDGKIRPAITVFRKRQKDKVSDMRVWNPLMAQFAGYNDNVSVSDNKDAIDCPSQIGDQGNLEFTQVTTLHILNIKLQSF
jgi:nitric oxide synthase oxygenase domain/subunit